jgi:hypothetical protein
MHTERNVRGVLPVVVGVGTVLRLDMKQKRRQLGQIEPEALASEPPRQIVPVENLQNQG